MSDDLLSRLLSALHDNVPGLDGTVLAEALWLAAHMAQSHAAVQPQLSPAEEGDAAGDGVAEPAAAEPPAAVRSTPDQRSPHTPRPAASPARPLHERLPGSGTAVHGRPVAAPRAAVLPRALELTRALRPWKRPLRDGRRTALDMDATVDGYARSGELIPVFAAAPERWFDLSLVVDRSPSMRVWHETVDEFTTVLDRLGAFRTLRVTDLTFDRALRPHTPGQLRSVDGRRLVVVVSDCTAEAWRRPEVWHLLREWAGTTPTAVLNPLPTKLWRGGGLNLPMVRFTSAVPGTHRSRVAPDPPLLAGAEEPGDHSCGEWLPIPVLSLTPHSLGRWSRALMRSDPEGCTAALVPPTGRLPGPSRSRARALPPATRATGFLRTAAPRAARLAVLCSPFDRLSLRLLHVIRHELVPDATTADVAEVVTSGLFVLEGDRTGAVELTPDAEAQAVLRAQLAAHELWRIHRAVSRYIASQGDGRGRLPAVVRGGEGARELPGAREAFAEASRRTLEMLGLTDEDTQTRTAGRSLPPAPPPLESHAHLAEALRRDLLAEPPAPLVFVTAVGGAAGAGRTAFALHLAHSVREHFPDGQFYADLRGSRRLRASPDAVLYRLLRDLGMPEEEIPQDTEELVTALYATLRGRRVLLVLDDVGASHLDAHFTAAPPEGSAVIVTTRDLPPMVPPCPTAVLTPVSGRDALALLGTVSPEAEDVAADDTWPLILRLLGAWLTSANPPSLSLLEDARGWRRDVDQLLGVRLRHLPGSLRQALESLALPATGDFSPREAAALLGTDEAAATGRILGALVGEGLLEERGPEKYGFHGAVQDHVIPFMHKVPQEMALRLLDLYLDAAATAYEERRPGTAVTARLRRTPLPVHLPQGWIDNAFGLLPPPEREDAWGPLLFLLQDAGATTPYRTRYERAVALRPTPSISPWALAGLAHVQYAGGRADAALRTLDRVTRAGVDLLDRVLGASVLLLRGRLLADRGLAKEAVADLRLAGWVFHEEGDRHGEATACLTRALLLRRTGRSDEAAEPAETAARLFEELGLTDEARTARGCLDRTPPGSPHPRRTPTPRPRTVIAVETAAHAADPRVRPPAPLPSVIRALLTGGAVSDRSRLRTHTSDDCCLVFVEAEADLDRLLEVLTEQLPVELGADGEPATLRLAVHTGPVDLDVPDITGEPAVAYTTAMLRSTEFRRVSANYPEHPTLCVSPEAYEALGTEGAAARRLVAREVTSKTGAVVCVVLTPRVDTYAPDPEVLTLARTFNELDPDGRRMARALRDSFDAVLGMEHTGRFDLRRLRGREPALAARELERALRRTFHFGAGQHTDLVRGSSADRSSVPFDVHLSLTGPAAWRFPKSARSTVCLVVHADDRASRWSSGLIRVRPESLVHEVNRDGAAGLTARARRSVLWLHRDAPLPENVLLHLDDATRRAILAPKSATARVAEFFRQVQGRPVPLSALRPLRPGRDAGRPIREAMSLLRPEGVLVVRGDTWGRAVAEALRLPGPAGGEVLSVRLTARRPEHGGRPTVPIGARFWVVAAPGDPVEPLVEGVPPPSRLS